MKVIAALIWAPILTLGLLSQYSVHAQTSQQDLMKTCNAQATVQKLAGDARKSFMSNCLSGKSVKTLTPQQQKMTTCNTHANSQKLTGDARKEFMSSCLKS